mmetsp:Transcript_18773/g.64577  ORF Transcript_18773/g.64577 Transcript_18773/m.64577 type:complete len:415 (+) Transcript_18773:269-1513(+)
MKRNQSGMLAAPHGEDPNPGVSSTSLRTSGAPLRASGASLGASAGSLRSSDASLDASDAASSNSALAIPIWRHPHMGVLDKVINWGCTLMLKMHELDETNVDWYRKTLHKVESLGYRKAVSMAHCWDVEMQGLPSGAALYLHRSKRIAKGDKVPLVIYIHGGGFVMGQARDGVGSQLLLDLAKMHDAPLAWAAVEYRRAPEHMQPAAADDCLDAVLQLWASGEFSKLSILGFSAGANLAIVTAAAASRRGLQVAALVAVCPFVDPTARSESYRTNAHQRVSPLPFLATCWRLYVGGAQQRFNALKDWRICPHSARDTWRNDRGNEAKPPDTILWTDLADPLLDEGRACVKAFEKAGGRVTHIEAQASHCVGITLDASKKKFLLLEWSKLLTPPPHMPSQNTAQPDLVSPYVPAH